MTKHADIDGAAEARARLYEATGRRIREVRTGLNMSQAGCARSAGIDTSSLFRAESGKQNLTLDTLGRLSLALGVPISELLTGVAADPDLVEPRSRAQ